MTILSIILFLLGGFFFLGGIVNLTSKANIKVANKKSGAVSLLIFGSLLVFIGWIVWPNEQNTATSNKNATVAKSVFNPEDLKVEAYTYAQEFVKNRLKAPATADFPWAADDYTKYVGDSTFVINCYVDAQNSFGANIRTYFKSKVKYLGTDNWEDVDTQLIDVQ